MTRKLRGLKLLSAIATSALVCSSCNQSRQASTVDLGEEHSKSEKSLLNEQFAKTAECRNKIKSATDIFEKDTGSLILVQRDGRIEVAHTSVDTAKKTMTCIVPTSGGIIALSAIPNQRMGEATQVKGTCTAKILGIDWEREFDDASIAQFKVDGKNLVLYVKERTSPSCEIDPNIRKIEVGWKDLQKTQASWIKQKKQPVQDDYLYCVKDNMEPKVCRNSKGQDVPGYWD